MAYTYTLDATTPADPDLISAGAGKIRALTLSLSERLASIFVNVNNDPLVFKGFSQSTGTAALNVVTIAGTLVVSGASSFTVTATVPAALNRGDAAALQGLLTISRVGSVKGYLGLTAADELAFLSANAVSANLTLTDAGALTVRAGLTATTGTFSSDLAVATNKFTVAAASGNTVIAGTLSMTTATSQIIPGSTGLSIRNHANGADNVFVTDAGAMIVEASITSTSGNVNAGVAVNAGTVFKVAAVQVLGPRITGWTAATGTPTRSTFATGSVTLSVLAEHVKALIDDFMTHGAIGT